jgi:hypothetical protein
MSSNQVVEKKYPQKPAHGAVSGGEVYSGPQEAWISRAEFDALYPPRSQFMYQND